MQNLALLPGLMCDERLFQPQVQELSKMYSVSVGDLTGQSSIEEMATEFLLSAPSKFSMAGLSMGGIVAMEVYRQAPHRIERIALLDTNHLAENEKVRLRRDSQIERANAGELRAVMQQDLKPKYVADKRGKQQILDICMNMAIELGVEVFKRQSRALQSRPDQTETLKLIDIPVLLLCGEKDILCPVERHYQMAELIPNSSVVVIKDVGHLTSLEDPQAVTEALKSLMEGKFD